MPHQSPKRELSPDGVEYNSPNKRPRTNTYQPQQEAKVKKKKNPFKKFVTEKIVAAKTMGVGVSGSSPAHTSSSNNLVPGTTPESTPKNDNQKTSHESTTSTVNSVGASAGEVTDAPDDPQTPIQTTGSRQLQTTPLSIKSSTGSIPHVDSPGKSTRLQLFEAESGVKMDLRLGYGDYVVSIQKRSIISSSTYENRKEDANQLPQNPGMQFLPSEMLSNMIEKAGEQMFARYLEWLRDHHMLGKSSVPRIDYSDQ
ncbi:hypothetical protein GLYMA_03G061300v4 [Glycine max]|nr:hypothetical protein GYH30_006375 [Glycine max]KRH65787.2 hypothetical protein GLYMA_03G061300v4 [Glycine max]